jgi:hypothetical protein
MTRLTEIRRCLVAVLAVICSFASAAEIGQIKTAKGEVSLERKGQSMPARVGMRLETADVLKTGADGSVGITMTDNSLLSAGPTASCRSIGSITTRRRTRAASTRSCKGAR